MKTVYIDLETTGLDHAKHAIWQLSALFEENGEVIDELLVEMKPHRGKLVSAQALEKTGMTLDKLETFAEPKAAFLTVENWLSKRISRYRKTDKAVFKAYSGTFDYNFLRQWWLDCGNEFFGAWFFHPYVDIMQKAALVLLPERLKMENFKLGTVCRYLDIEFDEDEAHDALYDNRKSRQLDKKLDEYLSITRLAA